MFLRTIICCSFMLSIAYSRLLQSPKDTEAVVGENVVLKCRTGINGTANTVEWRYQAVDGTRFDVIYSRGRTDSRFTDRYEVQLNTANSQYDLVVKNVQLFYAGRYTCDVRGNGHDAELIVFDKFPSNESCTLTSASKGNQSNCDLEPAAMSCGLRYRGNRKLRPTLEWRKGENTIQSSVVNGINGSITSYIQLQQNQIETVNYTCRVRYNDSKLTSRFTWSPTAITPTTHTNRLSYGGCENQTIECSDGNSHQCKYTWRDENNAEVSSSSSMEMAGKRNGNYTCLATCHVHSTPCSYVAKILNYRCYLHTSQMSSTTPSPDTIASPESIKSSPGITSPEIYVPVSIGVVVILSVLGILLVVRLLRRSICVRSEVTLDNCSIYDAEVRVESGPSNNVIEMTHFNGTKSQETDAMLTTNTITS